jgi:hypothetical protein
MSRLAGKQTNRGNRDGRAPAPEHAARSPVSIVGVDVRHADDPPVRACEAFGPVAILEDAPAFFWRGIHAADVLFSILGDGAGAGIETNQRGERG